MVSHESRIRSRPRRHRAVSSHLLTLPDFAGNRGTSFREETSIALPSRVIDRRVPRQTANTMKFYRVSGSRLWGDYGNILINGMSSHLPRKDGLLQLERSGPFLPPITLPGVGDLVVSSDFKDEFQRSGIAQVTFAPVVKAKIVDLRWEDWDRASPEPREIPTGGQPEDYIRLLPHSQAVAEQLGPLWEIVLPEDANVEAVRIGRGVWKFRLDPSTWPEASLFRATGKRHVIAVEEVKCWLESRAGKWLEFEETQPS
jgi:hypothetical protein